jgi:hypothetical protein
MTKLRVLLIVILSFMCMYSNSCSVNSPSPNFFVDLPVPFHAQQEINYCSIACVQMWAHWDGYYALSQDTIAQEVGIYGTGWLANPYDVERAVGIFTNSMGYLERRSWVEPGAEGDIIASTIEAIKHSTPSILPIDMGRHTILIKGYEWYEKNEII